MCVCVCVYMCMCVCVCVCVCVYMYVYIYIYIYIYMCVCVCIQSWIDYLQFVIITDSRLQDCCSTKIVVSNVIHDITHFR